LEIALGRKAALAMTCFIVDLNLDNVFQVCHCVMGVFFPRGNLLPVLVIALD